MSTHKIHLRHRLDASQVRSAVITWYNGYPYNYSCLPWVVNNSTTSPPRVKFTQVYFAYEIILPNPYESLVEVLYEDVPALKWGILQKVANSFGLSTCDLKNQGVDFWQSNETDDGNSTNNNPELVVVLSSGENDIFDPTTATCHHLTITSSDQICIPLIGMMDIGYIGDDSEAVQKFILYHIATEMDSQSVLVGQVRQIMYVGPRDESTWDSPALVAPQDPTPTINRTTSAPQAASTDSLNMAWFLPGILALLFLAVVLLVRMVVRRDRNLHLAASSVSAQELDAEDVGAVHTLDQAETGCDEANALECHPVNEPLATGEPDDASADETQPILRVPSGDEEMPSAAESEAMQVSTALDQESDLHDADSMIPLPDNIVVLPLVDEEAQRLQDDYPVVQTVTIADEGDALLANMASRDSDDGLSSNPSSQEDASDVDSNKVADRLGSQSDESTATPPADTRIVDVLPPLPPGAASRPVSKSMKRRRRKKKKPKKKVLVRTNSKENINEMETISEAVEEEAEEKEEECSGSEYSGSTSDSESRTGSRDPSPARSLGSAGSGGPIPASIKEEKKIRPLPPPWI